MFQNFNKIKKYTGEIVCFGSQKKLSNYIVTLILDNEITTDLVYLSGLFINGVYYDAKMDEINYYGSTIEIKPLYGKFAVTKDDIIYILYKSNNFETEMKYNNLNIVEETDAKYQTSIDAMNIDSTYAQVSIKKYDSSIYKNILGVIFNGVMYSNEEFILESKRVALLHSADKCYYLYTFMFKGINNFSNYSDLNEAYVYDYDTNNVKDEKIALINSFKTIYLSPKDGVENV
jgi:hypothetical protein